MCKVKSYLRRKFINAGQLYYTKLLGFDKDDSSTVLLLKELTFWIDNLHNDKLEGHSEASQLVSYKGHN